MIKKLILLFGALFLMISASYAENSKDNLLEIFPLKGDINTQFEISAYFKPGENSTGLEYKFKPHDSAPSSNWRSSSVFKFRVHREGTFRAHMLVRDSEGNEIEKTQIYKVFEKLSRQTEIYISNTHPKRFEKVDFEVKVWNALEINRDEWKVRWDFDGDGKFDTDYIKGLTSNFIYHKEENFNKKIYPIAEIFYTSNDSEKIRGDFIYPQKSKFAEKTIKLPCKNCGNNTPQGIEGNNKSIIQCGTKNEVGKKIIFDVLAPPNIVSMRPDFKGHSDWDFDFKPKTHWWWSYKTPGNYEVTFQLKDIYGKTSIIRKKIEILPSKDSNVSKKKKKLKKEEIKEKEKSEKKKEKNNSQKDIQKENLNENNKNIPSSLLDKGDLEDLNTEVKIKVKVSHREQKVFEKFLFNAEKSKGEDLSYEWRNPESKYPVVYGKKQLFYFETPGEKIITLKITDKNGETDEIKIPVTVKKADKQKDLQSSIPDLLGNRKKKSEDFRVRTGSNVPRPKFDTGMRPGF